LRCFDADEGRSRVAADQGNVTQADHRTARLGDLRFTIALGYQRDGLDMTRAEYLADPLRIHTAHVLMAFLEQCVVTNVRGAFGGTYLYQ